MDRSIQTLVDDHRLGLDGIFDQVDLAFVLDGGIGIEAAFAFSGRAPYRDSAASAPDYADL